MNVIRPFVGSEATEGELRQAHRLFLDSVAEENPDFPMPDFEQYAEQMRQPDSHIGRRNSFAAWDGEKLAGLARASFPDHENELMCLLDVRVAKDYRRQGNATALVRATIPPMRAENRRTVLVYGILQGSAAEAMLASLGFAAVYSHEWNQLRLHDTDESLWNVGMPTGFRLEEWENVTPEALLGGYAEARNSIHDAPRHRQTYAIAQWTPERIRLGESEMAAREQELWTAAAVHEVTGRVAAQTSITFMPGRTNICWQQDTSVVPDFRGHGLGRALKAAMIRKIRAERPGIGLISTGNATDNVHMIRVNRELGFHLDSVRTDFETGLDELAQQLGV